MAHRYRNLFYDKIFARRKNGPYKGHTGAGTAGTQPDQISPGQGDENGALILVAGVTDNATSRLPSSLRHPPSLPGGLPPWDEHIGALRAGTSAEKPFYIN